MKIKHKIPQSRMAHELDGKAGHANKSGAIKKAKRKATGRKRG